MLVIVLSTFMNELSYERSWCGRKRCFIWICPARASRIRRVNTDEELNLNNVMWSIWKRLLDIISRDAFFDALHGRATGRQHIVGRLRQLKRVAAYWVDVFEFCRRRSARMELTTTSVMADAGEGLQPIHGRRRARCSTIVGPQSFLTCRRLVRWYDTISWNSNAYATKRRPNMLISNRIMHVSSN